MSGDTRNFNENKRKRPDGSSIAGTPPPNVQEKHKERALAAGRRRTNQPIIKLRDTGDDNYMEVVKANHERRKMLDAEAKRGLPKELIYNPKQVIDSTEAFKDEVIVSKPTKRKSDEKPVTEA